MEYKMCIYPRARFELFFRSQLQLAAGDFTGKD